MVLINLYNFNWDIIYNFLMFEIMTIFFVTMNILKLNFTMIFDVCCGYIFEYMVFYKLY